MMEHCITLQKQVTFHLLDGDSKSTKYFSYPSLPNSKSSFRLSGCFWSFKYFFEQQQQQQYAPSSTKVESDTCHMFLNLEKAQNSPDIEFHFLCDSNPKANLGGCVLSQMKWISVKVSFINPETKRTGSQISTEGEPHCGKLLCSCRQSKLCLRKQSFCMAEYLQSFYVINKCSKPINGMSSTYYCSFDAIITLTLFPQNPNNNNLVSIPGVNLNNHPTQSELEAISKRIIFHSKIEPDFKFVLDGKEYPCHKCILAGHSKIFARMFSFETNSGKRRASSLSSTALTRLTLQNISVLGVESFLKYLYYSDTTFSELPAAVSFELLKLSERYGITHLTQASCQVLLSMKSLDELDLNTALKMYLFASSPSFPPVISSAQYSSFKKMSLQCFIKKYVDLVKSEEFVNLFQENQEKAQELLIKIHKNKDKL